MMSVLPSAMCWDANLTRPVGLITMSGSLDSPFSFAPSMLPWRFFVTGRNVRNSREHA